MSDGAIQKIIVASFFLEHGVYAWKYVYCKQALAAMMGTYQAFRAMVCAQHTHLIFIHERLMPSRRKKMCREIVEKDCQARKLNRQDAMDRNR